MSVGKKIKSQWSGVVVKECMRCSGLLPVVSAPSGKDEYGKNMLGDVPLGKKARGFTLTGEKKNVCGRVKRQAY